MNKSNGIHILNFFGNAKVILFLFLEKNIYQIFYRANFLSTKHQTFFSRFASPAGICTAGYPAAASFTPPKKAIFASAKNNMIKIQNLALLACLLSPTVFNCAAQEISFNDSIKLYNTQRLQIDRSGNRILAGWGLANVVVSVAGLSTAKTNDMQLYFKTNLTFGLLNTGLAGARLMSLRNQQDEPFSIKNDYIRYLRAKNSYLIGAGIDLGLAVTGLVILSQNQNPAPGNTNNDAGFARALCLQSVARLIYDNILFASFARQGTKWYRIMNEIQFSGATVGIVHRFK